MAGFPVPPPELAAWITGKVVCSLSGRFAQTRSGVPVGARRRETGLGTKAGRVRQAPAAAATNDRHRRPPTLRAAGASPAGKPLVAPPKATSPAQRPPLAESWRAPRAARRQSRPSLPPPGRSPPPLPRPPHPLSSWLRGPSTPARQGAPSAELARRRVPACRPKEGGNAPPVPSDPRSFLFKDKQPSRVQARPPAKNHALSPGALFPSPCEGPNLSSLLAAAAAAARSRAEAGTLQGEKFPPRAPPALASPSPPRSPFAPGSWSLLPEARFSRCTRQPNNHTKIPTHPCLRRRSTAPLGAASVVFRSERSSPERAGHPAAAAAAVPAARALGLEPRAEALGVRGARRRRRGAGRRRAAAGGGGRGASSQSEAQITAQPAGSSAGSPVCSVPPPPPRRRYCSPPRCSQLPITADADAQPSPSLVAPSRFSLAVSSSQTASEKGEGERSLGVRADSRSRSAAQGGEGAGGEGAVGEARRAGGRSRRRAWKLD
ncbi:proline-rich protein 36-like [Acinonyx jubatus]|uniref:Proline-rich protein 36-like n=1 Tax=Acinonyx jubatus TaxID=32536 RepID=A0ABM3NGG3_ACIJB|nr:proline-rich protein 36-like [Acinonyx jubatus]